MRVSLRITVALALLACAVSAGAWAQSANVVIVPTGTTIATIDDALSVAGVTDIIINSGTYTAPTKVIGDGISIRGASNSPQLVIVQGSPAGSVLEVTGKDVLIEGLTITGGTNGIYVHSGASVEVNRCYIHGNVASGATDGNGVLCDTAGTTATIVNSSIANNGGDGVRVQDGTANVYFSDLLSNAFCGLYCSATGTAKVSYSVIAQNSSTGTGTRTRAGLAAAAVNRVTPTQNACRLNATDYNANVTADAASLALEALPDPLGIDFSTPWPGKINDPSSVLIGKADRTAAMALTPLLSVDFENEYRRGSPTYDIGADQYLPSGGGNYWFECNITPNPMGEQATNGLSVVLQIVGSSLAFDTYDPANPGAWDGSTPRAFLKTNSELASPYDSSYNRLPLTVVYLGGSLYRATNAIAINTIGPNGYINDGKGKVILEGVTDPEAATQAYDGRFFIIDTQPPNLLPSSGAGDPITSYLVGSNDVYAPTPENLFTPRGYPSCPYGQASFVVPATPERVDKDGVGPSGFYNVGSQSNGYTDSPLVLTLRAQFKDAPPDQSDIVETAKQIDPALIEVAGFDISTVHIPGTAADSLFAPPVRGTPFWQFDAGYPSVVQPGDTLDTYYAGTPQLVTATWIFAGLPSVADTFAVRHLAIRFKAQDRAGNITKDDMLYDPIHLWWIRNVKTWLLPTITPGALLEQPQFTWKLRRDIDPASSVIKPVFAFQLTKVTPSVAPVVATGLDANGWSAWSTNTELTYAWFEQSGAMKDCAGHTVRLKVVAVDEAGNLETDPSGGNENLAEFTVPQETVKIDTSVTADFWHDANDNNVRESGDTDYGSALRFCIPETGHLRAVFKVTAEAADKRAMAAKWSLQRREKGKDWEPALYEDVNPMATDGTVTLDSMQLPENSFYQNSNGVKIYSLVPIEYRLLVQAGYPTPIGIWDPTPAEIRFTIVDCTKENVTVDSDQPVKVYQKK